MLERWVRTFLSIVGVWGLAILCTLERITKILDVDCGETWLAVISTTFKKTTKENLLRRLPWWFWTPRVAAMYWVMPR
jgi:hypothetical protein